MKKLTVNWTPSKKFKKEMNKLEKQFKQCVKKKLITYKDKVK